MRLIDADKLKKAFIGNRYGTKAIEYRIEQAETVEAIPIEWIKKWNQKNENFLLYMGLARKLIEDWEKENENNANKIGKEISTHSR